jgi:tRNA pseudouridine65 synthase
MEVLFEDEYLVAVNKPHGVFVHRSVLEWNATEFLVQIVRDMIGQRVYPVHRLDRKTGGVIVLSKTKAIQSIMNGMFRDRLINKTYIAIVRGFTEDSGTIDYALLNDKGKVQEARTTYRTLQRSEIPVSSGQHATSRYSLVELMPVTGRMHQLRKHMSHIFHPIIGDRPHGCNKQNRFFLNHFHMSTMMLHAFDIEFEHPVSKEAIKIKAGFQSEFSRMIVALGFELPDL